MLARSLAQQAIEEQLSNGLRVLYAPLPGTGAVSCWIWYRVGSRNERPGLTGISHWVEHMLFKGGGRLGKGDVFRWVQGRGGYNNAFTTQDYTVYFETLPAADWELGLRIESERMLRAAFDPKEVEAERTVMISERELSENTPQAVLAHEAFALAFQAHPYRWPVTGYKGDLHTITRDDLYTYYQAYYGPRNATLVLTGDFDLDAARGRADQSFGQLDGAAKPPGPGPEEPPQYGERRAVIRRPGGVQLIGLAYRTVRATDADAAALLLWDVLLTGAKELAPNFRGTFLESSSRHGRLTRGLVDAGIAAEVTSSFVLGLDPMVFYIRLMVQPGVSMHVAERALLAEVVGMSQQPPTEDELAAARQQLRARYAYDSEGATRLAYMLGRGCIFGPPHFVEQLVRQAMQIDGETLARIAERYFNEDQRCLCHYVAK